MSSLVAAEPLQVSATFDAGNIEVDSIDQATSTISARIRAEPFTEGTDKKQHKQWFYFRVSNAQPGGDLKVRITNAGASSYPSGWPNYKVCASYNPAGEDWFRCPDTSFDPGSGILEWSTTMPAGQTTIWFAYFAPYSYERHQQLIGRISASPFCRLRTLGATLDGRSIDMLVIGEGPKKFFVTARQHPGESMAEWCAEGFLERLSNKDDAMAKKMRQHATFFIVPNANPDGSVRGHLRTNACGANLNREWAPTGDYMAPTLERSPEVYHIMRVLDEQGCDGYLDIHGDEEIEVSRYDMLATHNRHETYPTTHLSHPTSYLAWPGCFPERRVCLPQLERCLGGTLQCLFSQATRGEPRFSGREGLPSKSQGNCQPLYLFSPDHT